MIRLRGEDSAVMAEAMAEMLRFAKADSGGEVYGTDQLGGKVLTWDFAFGPLTLAELTQHGLVVEGRHAEVAAAHVLGKVDGLIRSDE